MRLPFETDGGAGARASLGLLALQADETIEGDFRRLTNFPGVALHCARVRCAEEISTETLARMRDELPDAAAKLPSTGIAAVGYGCTSGATVIGENEVARAIRSAHPRAAASNPLTAAKAAMRALNIRRIALATPYAPAVSAAMRAALEDAGIMIAGFGSFMESDDRVVARISPKSCMDAAVRTARMKPCDGVFIACTNLRAAEIVCKAESVLGIPVVSANQALAWHLLRLAGIPDSPDNGGALFTVKALPDGD